MMQTLKDLVMDTLKKEQPTDKEGLWSPAAGVFFSAVFEIPGVLLGQPLKIHRANRGPAHTGPTEPAHTGDVRGALVIMSRTFVF